MRNHNEVVVLALAAMLVASLLTAGLMPSSFASHLTKTSTTPKLLGSQHVPIDSGFEIESISILAKEKRGSSGDPKIEIEILQDGELKGSSELSPDNLSKRKYNEVTVDFDPSVNVDGDFDIVVKATGKIFVKKEKDRDGSVPGYFVTAKNKQNAKFDLALEINSIPLEDMKDTFTSGNSDENNDDNSENPPDNNDSTSPGGGGTEPTPEGKAQLTVKAIDQNGNTVVPRMYIAVLQGTALVDEGFNDATFTLDAGENYMVEMDDYYDSDNSINFDFIEWIGSGHTKERTSVLLDSDKELTARYTITENSPPPEGPSNGGGTTSPPPSSDPGTVAAYAYRIPSSNWGSTFTGADAQVYFVLYNSAGDIVYTGFFDENGHVITGLNDGETYWIMPQDCHHCHGGTHDVRFHHWENGDTERARAVTNGMSVGAYYEFVPDTP